MAVEESPDGRSLVATGGWTGQAEKVLRGGEVDGLVLNYALGFAEQSLEFLGQWDVRRLDLLDRSIIDLSPIERLAGSLENVSVQAAPGAKLDLRSFRRACSTPTSRR